ncbi:hypothetical protein D3C77_49140 [compost metagenome]
MDWITFGTIHDRIRAAQLPGYSLHFNEGSDRFYVVLYGHNGQVLESREHSASILLEWVDEQLEKLGA